MADRGVRSDPELVRSDFYRNLSKAAFSHGRMGFFYQPVVEMLISRLDLPSEPVVVDLGCRSGFLAKGLTTHFSDLRVIGVDGVVGMVRAARDQSVRSSRFTPLVAPLDHLPLPDDSVELVISALSISQQNLVTTLREVKRVVAPGGQFMAAFVGRRTLGELASAWNTADDSGHIHPFSDLEEVGDEMVGAGFINSVVDRDRWQIEYSELETLFLDLRSLGETNVLTRRRRTLTGKGRFNRMRSALEQTRRPDGKIPISLEVIYAFGQLPHSHQVGVEHP